MLVIAYICTYTLPNWDALMTRPIAKAQGDEQLIVTLYAVLIVSGTLHSLSYFVLLKCAGAISAGVLNCLRAVCVFAASHVLFCDGHEMQCFTAKRGFSAILVVVGIMMYSKGAKEAGLSGH